jgi:putative CGCGG family rSAM target protein
MKEKNWSIALEHDEYEEDLELVVRDAIGAVEETAKGYYVNVVTPANLGNPDDFLKAALDDYFKENITTKFIDQCGCGGYVLRVWKDKQCRT